jgi:hypothetical protein
VIGCALEEQLAPTPVIVTPAPGDPPPELQRLQQIAEQIITLGPDYEFNAGLHALLKGLAEQAIK